MRESWCGVCRLKSPRVIDRGLLFSRKKMFYSDILLSFIVIGSCGMCRQSMCLENLNLCLRVEYKYNICEPSEIRKRI